MSVFESEDRGFDLLPGQFYNCNNCEELPIVDDAPVSEVHRTTTQLASGLVTDGTVSSPVDEETASKQTPEPQEKQEASKLDTDRGLVMYRCQDPSHGVAKPGSVGMYEPVRGKMANFLASLVTKHSFMAAGQSVCQAILNLVANL